jgi:hypothetical protein
VIVLEDVALLINLNWRVTHGLVGLDLYSQGREEKSKDYFQDFMSLSEEEIRKRLERAKIPFGLANEVEKSIENLMEIEHEVKSIIEAIEGNYKIPDEKIKQVVKRLKTVHNLCDYISRYNLSKH